MFHKTKLLTFFLIFILSISPSIGIVTAVTDVPLPGALVIADGDGGNGVGIANLSGQYLIEQGLGTGLYNMTASFEGYISQDLSKISVTAEVETPNINFLLLRSGGISGKVTDSVSGKALKDVMVFASSKTGINFLSYAITDSDGNYMIISNLPTGKYNVTVAMATGYLTKTVTEVSVTAGVETKNINLALLKSGVIKGKVTSAVGGQAIEGLTVLATGDNVEGMGYAKTDVNGDYRIDSGLETGKYEVNIMMPKGYISNKVTDVSVTANAETTVNIALVKSGVISGKITSTEGDQPLKGITVIAMGGSGGMATAQTDEKGFYRLDSGLETGKYSVTATSGTNINSVSDVSVTAGQETANVNMTLTVTPPAPSGIIKGRVTDNKNEAIEGAQVSVSGDEGSETTNTDIQGNYEISEGLGTGTYTVTVTEVGYIDSEKTDVSITVGSVTSDVNFKLEPLPAEQSGKISGTVRGEANPLGSKTPSTITCTVDKTTINTGESITASGAISPAVSGATVSLSFKKETTSIPVTATTGADGKYSTVYKPASTGSWTVSASWAGNTVYNGATSQPAAFTVNEASANGNLKIITKDSTGNMIIGVVVSSTAQPSGQQALSGTTQTDGSITFTGVKPGSYTLQAVKTGYSTTTGTQDVVAGSTATITITLQASSAATGDLKVTVKDSSGVAVSGATVTSTAMPSGQAALSGTTGADGTATFTGVILGAYTMQAAKNDYTTATGTGSAVAGSVTTISITLKSSSSGGGIPGFPIQATLMGIMLAIILFWTLQRKLQPIKNNVF